MVPPWFRCADRQNARACKVPENAPSHTAHTGRCHECKNHDSPGHSNGSCWNKDAHYAQDANLTEALNFDGVKIGQRMVALVVVCSSDAAAGA